jgi:hypothetical protein
MILNVKTTTRDGLVNQTGRLADGTRVEFCSPHHRWEWDCECGHVNSTRALTCDDCGRDRVASTEGS